MFKFKFIKGKANNHPLINLISPPYTCFKENDDTLEKIYVLVLMNEKEQKVVGGACLTRKNLEALQEEIKCFLPMGVDHSSDFWECSTIYFPQSKLIPPQASLQENFLRHFYSYLYEGIVAFGKQRGIGFVVVKLTANTYSPTKKFGLWPYIIQLLPTTCPDDLFYGILPLKGSFYESYRKQRNEMKRKL